MQKKVSMARQRSRPAPTETSSRKGIRYFIDTLTEPDPLLLRRRDFSRGFFSGTLIQDLGHGIAFMNTLKFGRSNIQIVPPGDNNSGLVSRGLGEDSGTSLDFALNRFLEGCVHWLACDSKAIFEIIWFSDPSTRVVTGFELFPLPPWSIKKSGRKVVQILPDEVAKRAGVSKTNELDSENIVEIRLPKREEVILTKTLRALERLGHHMHPTWGFKPENHGKFDYGLFKSGQGRALLAATQQIGWTVRGQVGDFLLEPYLLLRYLRFQEFKISCRNAILSQLNKVLEMVGERMGRKLRLELTGIPTLDTVRQGVEGIQQGSMSFREVMALF